MSDSDKKPTAAGKSGKKSVKQVGDFELKKKLGKGGMGEVFLAKQVSLDRVVALKTLNKEYAKKDDFVARFQREARSMAKLDHPNVVKVYAVDSFKGIHFAAIEYVDGKSVQDWLDKLNRFDVGDAVHIGLVCAEALRTAHAKNMVHRDIKPDNILLTKEGAVKVADFGLAKALDEDVSMTQSGTGLGTPLYMAPEQARSAKTVDQRSDIYALGATMYHMLTGVLPYKGGTALELIIAKESGKHDSARKLRSEVPERLDLIIDKMMSKEPEHRYEDCEGVVRDLAALGIHHDTLSFIDGALPAGLGRVAASTVVLGKTAANSATSFTAAGADVSSRDDARRSQVKKKSRRTWFVQYTTPDGQMAVEKHSTNRVLKLIKAGTLTAKARAKASATGSYMPLSQFPEFTEAVEAQLTQQTASARQRDMKTLYKQVERDQTRLKRWRWVSNRIRGAVGFVSLIVWLAVVGALGFVLLTYGKEIFRYMGSKVTEMMS